MSIRDLRQAIVEAARAMNDRGLSRGTSGNLSARVPDGMLITPSAVPYHALDPDDLPVLDLEGRVLDGSRKPSTEWRLHAAVLRARPEIDSVLHAHPPFCTTLACMRRPIPALHYMIAVAGGDSVRCAPYATFGSPELADGALAALERRRACLLANHGMVALAASPAAALALAAEVETLAEIYWRSLAAGGPALLRPEDVEEARGAFLAYR